MGQLHLITYPNPILSVPTKEVTLETLEQAKANLPEVIRIMLESKGVGLAANQAGLDLSFAVIDLTKDAYYNKEDKTPLVLINPKILKAENPIRVSEGCLSLPGFHELVTRPSTVIIEYRDMEYNLQEKELTGLIAQCAVHEVNHLAGHLTLDEMSLMVKGMYMKKLKKRGLL